MELVTLEVCASVTDAHDMTLAFSAPARTCSSFRTDGGRRRPRSMHWRDADGSRRDPPRKAAVTHRSALDDLRGFGAEVHPEARVVGDGDVLTSAGVTSVIDLALHLIEVEHGRDAALRVAHRHDFRGPVIARVPEQNTPPRRI